MLSEETTLHSPALRATALRPEESIRRYFEKLFRLWGPQHWWPAESPFEVIVGAFLTQNTSWTNVERALAKLREAKVLSIRGIRDTPLPRLERLIRSAGYFRQKSRRLKTFVRFLDKRYGGSLARMFSQPTAQLRDELLALNGVGPETADSILLYAGHHPAFVVDAYTRRILERHELIPEKTSYEEIRALFEHALGPTAEKLLSLAGTTSPALSGPANSSHSPSRMSLAQRSASAQVFSEMHGLIVGVGKNFCKKSQPQCDQCPLRDFLPGAR
jgi:endonuclease III related protein